MRRFPGKIKKIRKGSEDVINKSIKWILPMLILIMFMVCVFAQVFFRIVLCQEFNTVSTMIAEVIQRSPVYIIAKTLNSAQGVTARAMISSEDIPMRSKMTVLSENGRYLANGELFLSDERQHFSLFFDQNSIAVSSDVLNDVYYGICYQSFLRDIRNNPMLRWIVTEKTAETWNNSVQKIKNIANKQSKIPVLTEIDQLWKLDLSGLLMIMPSRISKSEFIQEGERVPVIRMVYQIDSEQIPEFLQKEFPISTSEKLSVTASFYLKNRQLIMTEIEIHEADKKHCIVIEQSEAAWRICYLEKEVQKHKEYSVILKEQKDRTEAWKIIDNEEEIAFRLSWNPEEGDMTFSSQEKNIKLKFKEMPLGFSVETEDIRSLLDLSKTEITENYGISIQCNAVISAGGRVDTPDFKNIDQWSMQDFSLLMEGIGLLMGWETG